jgi:hypothetical protein
MIYPLKEPCSSGPRTQGGALELGVPGRVLPDAEERLLLVDHLGQAIHRRRLLARNRGEREQGRSVFRTGSVRPFVSDWTVRGPGSLFMYSLLKQRRRVRLQDQPRLPEAEEQLHHQSRLEIGFQQVQCRHTLCSLAPALIIDDDGTN